MPKREDETPEEHSERKRQKKEKKDRGDETEEERSERKRQKKEKKEKEYQDAHVALGEAAAEEEKESGPTESGKVMYPPPANKPDEKCDTTILLFYAYCNPPMTTRVEEEMIARCTRRLSELGITGRLRIGKEGFNATLTGPTAATREFTTFLRQADAATFGETDFKYVDKQNDNKRLKGLKVWHVQEIVTYGFDPAEAPLDMRGTHLKPHDFHKAMEDPDAIMIDVRNFNESVIGKFAPPNRIVLDPEMRRSTEFPEWVESHKKELEGKKVLMYCTAGVRCERASAFLRNKGVQNVFQLDGGIHRYLDAFPDDGGYWVGKNYTFDKRFSHGAEKSATISTCVVCKEPWDRYQAQEECQKCHMEVVVCRTCQRQKLEKRAFCCPLCSRPKGKK